MNPEKDHRTLISLGFLFCFELLLAEGLGALAGYIDDYGKEDFNPIHSLETGALVGGATGLVVIVAQFIKILLDRDGRSLAQTIRGE